MTIPEPGAPTSASLARLVAKLRSYIPSHSFASDALNDLEAALATVAPHDIALIRLTPGALRW